MTALAATTALSEDEARRLQLLRRLQGGEGLADYIRRRQPQRVPPRHILPLIRRIEEARVKPLRLVVELPPRHAKTTTVVNAFPWWLRQFPADTCGYYTYSDRKARSESRKILELSALDGGIRLDQDRQSAQEWRTMAGGGLLAGGAGGGLTGYGISGLFVVDDPYKNRREAESALVRDNVYNWFNDVAFTRDEGCSFIVMHTRWHEDDLIGRLLVDGWEELRLPAIAEEDDPAGREPGEALWPDIYPIRRLERIKRQIGEFRWASLYQQRPRPRGAKLFGPEHYYDPKLVDFTGCTAHIGADTAATKKTTADSSAACAGMVRDARDKAKKTLYVTDALNEQETVPQFCRDLRAFQARNHGAVAWVEDTGIGKGTYQVIKDTDPGARVKPSPAKGDKFQRFQGVAAAWNDARVLVPLGPDSEYPWRRGWLKRIQAVTGVNDSEDDDADALAHLWNNAKGPVEVGKPRIGGKAAD